MATEGDPSGGWRFAQCFGDKGEVEDITEGECMRRVIMQAELQLRAGQRPRVCRSPGTAHMAWAWTTAFHLVLSLAGACAAPSDHACGGALTDADMRAWSASSRHYLDSRVRPHRRLLGHR